MGQVRKFFPYSHQMTGVKPETFPLRENRLGFLIYGASGLVYLLTFVKNGKIFLRNILVVLMSVSLCSLLTLGVQQS